MAHVQRNRQGVWLGRKLAPEDAERFEAVQRRISNVVHPLPYDYRYRRAGAVSLLHGAEVRVHKFFADPVSTAADITENELIDKVYALLPDSAHTPLPNVRVGSGRPFGSTYNPSLGVALHNEELTDEFDGARLSLVGLCETYRFRKSEGPHLSFGSLENLRDQRPTAAFAQFQAALGELGLTTVSLMEVSVTPVRASQLAV